MAETRLVLKALNITCLKATEHHSRLMDGALGVVGYCTLRVHFAHCPPCAQTAVQLALIRKAFRSVSHGDVRHGDRLAPVDPKT